MANCNVSFHSLLHFLNNRHTCDLYFSLWIIWCPVQMYFSWRNTWCSSVYLYIYLTFWNWANVDDKSAEIDVNLRMFLREETGPTCWRPTLHHKRACSELWSLSWLSSLARESLEWWSAAILENSECSNSAFFTLTSSFSFAIAPCWPPFTRFHFILLFWNHTFTYRKNRMGESTQCRLKVY